MAFTIGTHFDREFRQQLQDKINNMDANNTKAVNDSTKAKTDSAEALTKANQAKTTADQVRTEFDNVIAEVGSNNPEVVQSRKNFVNLNARLNATDESLAQNIRKGEASVFDIDKNKGLFDQTFFSDEVKQQWAGNTPVNAVPTNSSLITKKFADKSVTLDKTDFLKVASANLFNKDDILLGKTINSTTGEPSDSASFSLSNFIPVEAGQSYITNYQTRYGFYDASYNFISTSLVNGNVAIATPANTRYIRVAIPTSNLNAAQLNKGNVILPYDSYKISVKNVVVQGADVKNLTVTKNMLNFLQEYASTNLFNKYDITPNKSISSINGVPVDNANFSLTGFIPAIENVSYVASHQTRYGFYDANYVFISSVLLNAGLTAISPANTVYIRAAVPTTMVDIYQLNQSDELLPFEPYAFYLNGAKISYEVEDDYSFKDDDKFVVAGNLEGTYSAPIISAPADFQNFTASQMFSLYDQLVAAYPHYVTKTTLGQDGLGDDIFRYDFKPNDVDVPEAPVKLPKMILVSGVHGSEKAGVYALYQAMKQICEAWDSDESLEVLRWNVHFIVVPIVNLYSFNGNALRKNENGVDLARNFPANWDIAGSTDPTSPTYRGTAPLTEQGSILVDQLMKENKDAIYFTSFHNFSTPPNNNYAIWNAGSTILQTNLGKKIVSKMSRKWKKEYEWLPQDETTYFGYASGTIAGSEGAQAVSYGIQGGTFEIGQEFFLEPNHTIHSDIVYTLGTETFINWLVLNLKYNVDFYNHNEKF